MVKDLVGFVEDVDDLHVGAWVVERRVVEWSVI